MQRSPANVQLSRFLPALVASQSVQVHGPSFGLGPGDDVGQAPDAAHCQLGDGLGKFAALGELIDACAPHAEDLRELLTADEFLHPTSIDTCLVQPEEQFEEPALNTCLLGI